MIRDTLRALAQPRRALPILTVIGPVLYLQRVYSRSWSALLIGLLLCVAFVLVAPASWRYLFPPLAPDDPPRKDVLFRLGVYVLLGAGMVSGIGSTLPRVFDIPPSFLTVRSSLLVCVALFWVGGWGLGRDVDFEYRLDAERERARAAVENAERARLLAIANHLDPHFLFNTLNAIAEWCREDGVIAEAAVLRLSSLLRSIMEGISGSKAGGDSIWSLAREVELVRGLWELHHLRDPGAFDYEISVPEVLGAREVPSLVLLGLAENAVKHGPAAGHHGRLTLTVTAVLGGVEIVLENPGGYSGPRAGGQGMDLTDRRARSHFGSEATLLVESETGERTRARLFLPSDPSAHSFRPEIAA